MRHDNAAVRVRRRIADWVKEQGHGSRTRLAAAVTGLYGETRSQSWVTDLIDGPDNGGQDLRLRDLDSVADAMGVPPGDLVKRHDNLYLEVTPTEMRLLRFFRSLPDVARHHMLGYFDYLFAMQQRVLEAQTQEREQRTAAARRVRDSQARERRRKIQ